jgi:hypothetical protein
MKGLALVGTVTGVAVAFWGPPLALYFALSSEISDLEDPETGYPALVREGAKDAISQAIREDEYLKIKITTEVGETIQRALEANNQSIQKLDENLVAELRDQTRQLSNNIVDLRIVTGQLQGNQELILYRLFGEVPEDPQDFLSRWQAGPGFEFYPVWVTGEEGFDTIFEKLGGEAGGKVILLDPQEGSMTPQGWGQPE